MFRLLAATIEAFFIMNIISINFKTVLIPFGGPAMLLGWFVPMAVYRFSFIHRIWMLTVNGLSCLFIKTHRIIGYN